MNYNELLNHKSCLCCDNEKDIAQHAQDVEAMIVKLDDFAKHGFIAKFQYVDEYHKKNKSRYVVGLNIDNLSVVEGSDFKNGVDMVIHDGLFGVVCYGQNYTHVISNETHMLEEHCSFRFFNDMTAFEKAEGKSDKRLAKMFDDDSLYLNTDELFTDLRGVKRKELDEIIKNAEDKIEEKRLEKENERRKKRNKKKNITDFEL